MTGPTLDIRAYALRPVRWLAGRYYYYTPVSFVGSPFRGCQRHLARALAVGRAGNERAPDAMVDVLDRRGRFLQRYPVSRRAFEDLRAVLRFRADFALSPRWPGAPAEGVPDFDLGSAQA